MATADSVPEAFSSSNEEHLRAFRKLFDKDKRSRVGIILIGETGQGKSSLINGLLGQVVASEGHDLVSHTRGINEYFFEKDGVTVNVWDTQGFEMEIGDVDVSRLQAIAKREQIHLILYCVRMDNTRWPNAIDAVTIHKMTEVFGKGIWQHCRFVLTFGNQVAGLCPHNQEVEEYFSERVCKFEEQIGILLKDHAGLSDEDVVKIQTAIPVGDPRPHQTSPKSRWDLPNRLKNWLIKFWCACAEIMPLSCLPSLFQLNEDRFDYDDINSLNPSTDKQAAVHIDELSSAEVTPVHSPTHPRNGGGILSTQEHPRPSPSSSQEQPRPDPLQEQPEPGASQKPTTWAWLHSCLISLVEVVKYLWNRIWAFYKT